MTIRSTMHLRGNHFEVTVAFDGREVIPRAGDTMELGDMGVVQINGVAEAPPGPGFQPMARVHVLHVSLLQLADRMEP